MQPILRYLLLLLTFLWLTVSLGFSNEEKLTLPKSGKTKFCNGPIPPGVDILIRGVDITELNMIITNNNGDTNGIAGQAIALSCNDGRTWISPSNEETYLQPEQISIVRPTPAGNLQIASNFFCSSEEYKSLMATKVSVNVKEEGIFSVSAQNVRESISQSNCCLAWAEVTVSTMQIHLKSPRFLKVTDSFTVSLPPETLVPKYEESPAVYDNLVATFGTHYFERAIFGGVLRLEMEIDSAYIEKKDKHSIAWNLESAFNQTFGPIIQGNYEERKVTKDFINYSSLRSVDYYGGGVLSKENSNAFKEWFQLVRSEPILIGGQLKPIVDLIDNEDIKTEVRKAIAAKQKAIKH